MAHIQSCQYCHGNVCDAPWHPACRIAYLEDTLHEARQIIDDPRRRTLDHLADLAVVLHREKWRPMAEFEAERAAEATRQLQQVLQDGAKALFLQNVAREWDASHPGYTQVVTVLGKGPGGETLTIQA